MLKFLYSDKDTYIVSRVIRNQRTTTANVGAAGTLDLYKLYGLTSTSSAGTITPNTELSRLLVHFNMQPLRDLVAQKLIDPSNGTFNCVLHLSDVYGGQPTSTNFTVSVFPLSASFDEGVGRDLVLYGDNDIANWLTASVSGTWFVTGCASGGLPGNSVDYITASSLIAGGAPLEVKQLFQTGVEDLNVNITSLVSATLAGLLPDAGFRITLSASLEQDQHTWFVKRFASRSAFDETLRPRLVVKFDDSIQDDSQTLYFDSRGYLFLYNYTMQSLANISSGSSSVTGSNCIVLTLATQVSGGTYNLVFTGSQHTLGTVPVNGVYSASVLLSSTDTTLASKLAVSGSVNFTPIWGSVDGTVAYLTGSTITAYPALRGSAQLVPKRLIVTVTGLQDSHFTTDASVMRVNIFDYTSPRVKVVKLPAELPGIVVRDVHYQVRDAVSHTVVIPFDTTYNSTRVSSDSNGMFFKLDMSNLTQNRSYVIDIMLVTLNNRQVFKACSPVFRVSDTQ